MTQRWLSQAAPASRQPRRVLMHVIDAGPDDMVRMHCAKCGAETEWHRRPRAEAKRGVPCPKCNAPDGRTCPPVHA